MKNNYQTSTSWQSPTMHKINFALGLPLGHH